MKQMTFKRWLSTTSEEFVTVRVDDDYEFDAEDVDFSPFDFPHFDVETELVDVHDTGPWEET